LEKGIDPDPTGEELASAALGGLRTVALDFHGVFPSLAEKSMPRRAMNKPLKSA
jgi:hypothetical protein